MNDSRSITRKKTKNKGIGITDVFDFLKEQAHQKHFNKRIKFVGFKLT